MQTLEQLKNYLYSHFVELDHAIEALLLGLAARKHVFLLGPPGTAKSHLAEVICEALELKSFRCLLTDETKFKDIFGIQSIEALKEDRDMLITAGKLPEAELAYLDEIWKANSSVVNMLLWALRDGSFVNNGKPVKMPLKLAICCSNEIPEDSSRRAIYDRLLLREEVKDIEMGENFRKVLDRNGTPPPKVEKKELQELWKAQQGVKVPDDIKDLYAELREKMHDAGVRSSNRRWFESMEVLKAAAALDGRTEVESQDIEVLSSTLWHHPEEKVTVRQTVLSLTDPGLARVLELFDDARNALEKLKKNTQGQTGGEAFAQASQAASEVAEIIKEAEKIARSKREKAAVEKIQSIQRTIMKDHLKLRA